MDLRDAELCDNLKMNREEAHQDICLPAANFGLLTIKPVMLYASRAQRLGLASQAIGCFSIV
jgi:hypothetical protein